jgi:tetratricopeptide (TPR) repeat protein
VNRRADKLNTNAMELDEKGWHAEAEAKYREAAGADPTWAAPLFNLGLLMKRQHRWAESLLFNRHAIAIEPAHEGALWNLGIAATALGDWNAARQAWRDYGVEIPDGQGPIELDLGLVPIRANQEVIWCRRVDPARAVVLSVPFPESGRFFRDLLLHDGAPNGSRWYRGREVPVFDELVVLERSGFDTFSFNARVSAPEHIQKLGDLAAELDLAAEDWTTVEILCEACSQGLPHKHHLREAKPWVVERHLAVAARTEAQVDCLVDRWCELTGAEFLEDDSAQS